MRIASPAVVRSGLPETAISASPSSRCELYAHLTLGLVEREQRNCARRSVDQRPADNSSFLVIHEVSQADDFRNGHFTVCACCELMFGNLHRYYFCHMRNPPRKAFRLLPSCVPVGSFFSFLLFPPPSTT